MVFLFLNRNVRCFFKAGNLEVLQCRNFIIQLWAFSSAQKCTIHSPFTVFSFNQNWNCCRKWLFPQDVNTVSTTVCGCVQSTHSCSQRLCECDWFWWCTSILTSIYQILKDLSIWQSRLLHVIASLSSNMLSFLEWKQSSSPVHSLHLCFFCCCCFQEKISS